MSMIRTEPRSRAPRLEQLLFAGTYRSIRKLGLHHLEAFFYFRRFGAGAITAEHELHHIGRDRELSAEPPDQVLADDVSGEGVCRLPIQVIKRRHVSRPLWLAPDGQQCGPCHQSPPGRQRIFRARRSPEWRCGHFHPALRSPLSRLAPLVSIPSLRSTRRSAPPATSTRRRSPSHFSSRIETWPLARAAASISMTGRCTPAG